MFGSSNTVRSIKSLSDIDDERLYLVDHRYNACWLPLIAKHSESKITKGPLVVPLDCEWIWHCHRLNPVRYKPDCEEFYGRILDNSNVVYSINQGTSRKETEETWNKLYPNEPYEYDMSRASSSEFSETLYNGGTQSFSKYDFVLAVERQSPFFYQASFQERSIPSRSCSKIQRFSTSHKEKQ
ncbi:unnamed protein product [Lactuca virosa]|uniref:Uncharacterized protein n=1 Tax=Lactuca virosa TaxID=75947 RepID=A0AAU9MGX4_9ASTR|nr:unnamed protein product [Lactuca virosa]